MNDSLLFLNFNKCILIAITQQTTKLEGTFVCNWVRCV